MECSSLFVSHFLHFYNNIIRDIIVFFCLSEGTFSALAGRITLSVIEEDLTRQTTAVIVNSVLDISNLYTGNISRAIITQAGHSVQVECDNQGKVKRHSPVLQRVR